MNPIVLEVCTPLKSFTLTFDRFPVRLGRGDDCDCILRYAFVSRHHATIDLRGHDLVIIDEGARNSVRIDERALARGEVATLRPDGGAFAIGSLSFRVWLVAADSEDAVTKDAATAVATVVNARNPTRAYADAKIDVEALLGAHAEFAVLRAATEALRALAGAERLESEAKVRASASRLEQLLRLFADGFVTLRAVYRGETDAREDLDRIESGEDLLAWALDAHGEFASRFASIERAFVNMATHHARFVARRNAREKHMLSDLDPAAIDAALPRGMPLFRHRRLWAALTARHAHLSAEFHGAPEREGGDAPQRRCLNGDESSVAYPYVAAEARG